MVHVMVVMVMMVMVMMVMVHRFSGLRSRPRGSAGDCGLREGISAEAEREHGGGCQGFDHVRFPAVVGEPRGSLRAMGLSA
jgi:hypothetical protein